MRHRLTLLLFAIPLVARGQTADEKKATVAYVHSLEVAPGGFTPGPAAKGPSLRATGACVRALRYFGGSPGDLAGCRTFVRSCYDPKTGGFADRPGGNPDAIHTAAGLMAMVELKMPTAEVENRAITFMTARARSFEEVRLVAAALEAVKKPSPKNPVWVADLRARQNPDGTFGKGKALARETGGAVACLLRLGGKVEHPKKVVAALDAAQNADGGFGKPDAKGSDLETSYRVVRTYHMLGAKPRRAAALARFIARCRNADGGYGVAPGAASSPGGTYFASIILHWLGRP